ncbi:hypothetical protein RND81_08G105600 [Saponaria officinalis]|uniref:PH domain-containing protein n=1 Tax=Saponaria officinalis TaxID=3572 RepID=A0AAW1J6I4_SAPOF
MSPPSEQRCDPYREPHWVLQTHDWVFTLTIALLQNLQCFSYTPSSTPSSYHHYHHHHHTYMLHTPLNIPCSVLPLCLLSGTSATNKDSSRTSSATISHFHTNSFTSPNSPHISNRNKFRAAFMLRLFSLKGLRFTTANGEEKVELTSVELESLRSELKDVEEREAHLKAQAEHLDEILRSARLSGYLYMRTRWAALPGELPLIDDCDVDDWIPRFTVLQGPCLFFYLSSTDLSPLDSTLLSDIVEVDQLPSFVRDDEEIWHCFYIVTCHGLRIECSSVSRIQVDSWLTALREDCKFEAVKTASTGENCDNISQNCVSSSNKLSVREICI